MILTEMLTSGVWIAKSGNNIASGASRDEAIKNVIKLGYQTWLWR